MAAEAETIPGGAVYDVAVIGAGAAGLHVAIEAAERGARACIVSRKPLSDSASYWAQGGLAAALAPDDSPERHAEDTLNAGRGLCRASAVEVLVREAPAAVEALIRRGVRFDRDPAAPGSESVVRGPAAPGREAEDAAGLSLGLEGGHSARRIVHAGGAETGRALTSRLAELAAAHERIDVVERTSALALGGDGARCGGVVTDHGPIRARATVLATGGGAALWARTSNPWGAVGAGAVLANAAGAELADLELCQFHPTALALPGHERDGALVTEAVRGEGATLLDASGRRFTDELAPRDQVTAAILDRMDADGAGQVWLDLRALRPESFPSVFATLRAAGLDPQSQPVPVAPAAHYLIGGVATDLHGRTTLRGLYAIGECACTGLHGANRLASNSLSECFVFGARAAAAAVEERDPPAELADPGWRFTPPTVATREALWRLAGPRRTAEDLERLLDDPYPLARQIAASALARRESRGAHRRSDFPRLDPQLGGIHFVVTRDGSQRSERWA